MPSAPVARAPFERIVNPNATLDDIRRTFNTVLDDLEERLGSLESFDQLPNTSIEWLRLSALDAAPDPVREGQLVLADGVAWDPLGLSPLNRPYLAVYISGGWKAVDDYT